MIIKSAAKDPNAIRDEIDAIRKNGNIRGFERWREIGGAVIGDVNNRGRFFNTDAGLFLFDSDSHQAVPLNKDEVGLAALMNGRYGINSHEHGFGRVLTDLQSEAHSKGQPIEIRRLAHYDKARKVLYVSRFDGYMYRLDGESVAQVENGTEDVFFFDSRRSWQPYSYIADAPRGELDRQLIDSVNCVDSNLSPSEQRKLLKIWLLALFFGSIQPTKIILLLLGDHGSGKTSALRRIQKFIFGAKADLLSIEKNKEDGFIATVTTDPVALFDNLDERIPWLPFALSRLATGVTFSRRQLYTTNNKLEFPGVSWLGITSRTVSFMYGQPDLPDRTLVLRVERLGEKQPEQALLSAIALQRNAIWSELLDELNAVIRHMGEPAIAEPVQFRMADFASFALTVGTTWHCRPEIAQIFAKLEEEQADLVFEDDAVHQILQIWLQTDSNQGRTVDAAILNREWSILALRNEMKWEFSSPKSLGQRLKQLQHALEQKFGVAMVPDRHNKQNQYRFWRKGLPAQPQAAVPGELPAELQSAEPLRGSRVLLG